MPTFGTTVAAGPGGWEPPEKVFGPLPGAQQTCRVGPKALLIAPFRASLPGYGETGAEARRWGAVAAAGGPRGEGAGKADMYRSTPGPGLSPGPFSPKKPHPVREGFRARGASGER